MYAVLALIGIAMFAASLVLEKKAARTADGGPAGVIMPLRAGGVVAVTVGFVAMCILASINGGFFTAPPAV